MAPANKRGRAHAAFSMSARENGAAGTTVHYRSFVSDKGEQKRYTFAPKDARDSTVWDLREQLRRSESVTAGAAAR